MREVKFGVDGIRDVAGEWPFLPAIAVKIGQALGRFVNDKPRNHTVVIGRDTRPSGQILTDCLVAGLTSQGVNVFDFGIIPTPGVAFFAKQYNAGLGIVVSASHNPPEYNGLKLFAGNGLRLQQSEETEVEALINEYIAKTAVEYTATIGTHIQCHHLIGRYIQDHVDQCHPHSLEGLRIVLDCANGAASLIAPAVFSQLGADAKVINDSLNGVDINYLCGSEHARKHPDDLIMMMHQHDAEYGFAFDGDGDRLLVVDTSGYVFDGNDLLFVLAKELQVQEVVTILLANRGLKEGLSAIGLTTIYVNKGDKNIEKALWENGYKLGGEPGGNIILNDGHHTVADAIYIAALLAAILAKDQTTNLKERISRLHKYPQITTSTKLSSAFTGEQKKLLDNRVKRLEKSLREDGRIMAYSSETEPGVMRVLVEGGTRSKPEAVVRMAARICEIIQSMDKQSSTSLLEVVC